MGGVLGFDPKTLRKDQKESKKGISEKRKDDLDLNDLDSILGKADPDLRTMEAVGHDLGILNHQINAGIDSYARTSPFLKGDMFADIEKDINLVHGGKAKS